MHADMPALPPLFPVGAIQDVPQGMPMNSMNLIINFINPNIQVGDCMCAQAPENNCNRSTLRTKV